MITKQMCDDDLVLLLLRGTLSKRIRDLEDEQKAKENQKLIGKCYKSTGEYYLGHKPHTFDEFCKVTSLDTDGQCVGITFSNNLRGYFELDKDKRLYGLGETDSYTKITAKEYDAAMAEFFEGIEAALQ